MLFIFLLFSVFFCKKGKHGLHLKGATEPNAINLKNHTKGKHGPRFEGVVNPTPIDLKEFEIEDIPFVHASQRSRRSIPSQYEDEYIFGVTAYPECQKAPTSQGSCGNCWLYSVSQAMTDRVCKIMADNGIDSSVYPYIRMSPQTITSCYNDVCSQVAGDYFTSCPKEDVCGGGQLMDAWKSARTPGWTFWECDPYTGGVETCPSICEAVFEIDDRIAVEQEIWGGNSVFTNYDPWRDYMFSSTDYGKMSNQDMMLEIYENGPITAIISTWGSTLSDYTDECEDGPVIIKYTSSGEYLWDESTGAHAIEIIGWGTYGADRYWVVKNSWGDDWGMLPQYSGMNSMGYAWFYMDPVKDEDAYGRMAKEGGTSSTMPHGESGINNFPMAAQISWDSIRILLNKYSVSTNEGGVDVVDVDEDNNDEASAGVFWSIVSSFAFIVSLDVVITVFCCLCIGCSFGFLVGCGCGGGAFALLRSKQQQQQQQTVNDSVVVDDKYTRMESLKERILVDEEEN